jgi:hypothetical protein
VHGALINHWNMPMHQIIYFSSASRPFTRQDVLDILTVSRVNNARDGITGMLLCKDGSIMQVLEGEADAVQRCFARVSRDTRHSGIIVVESSPIARRQFGDWSMEFRDLDDADVKTLPGYNSFFRQPVNLQEVASDASATQRLLHFFAGNLRQPARWGH